MAIDVEYLMQVLRTLTKDVNLFQVNSDSSEALFGLLNSDVTQVKPNYEMMLKGGHLKMTDVGIQPGKVQLIVAIRISWISVIHVICVVGGSGLKGRGAAKRKLAGDNSNAGIGKRNRVETAPVKLSPHGYPLEHPYNKDGFRYFLAEPDPHAPFRQVGMNMSVDRIQVLDTLHMYFYKKTSVRSVEEKI